MIWQVLIWVAASLFIYALAGYAFSSWLSTGIAVDRKQFWLVAGFWPLLGMLTVSVIAALWVIDRAGKKVSVKRSR